MTSQPAPKPGPADLPAIGMTALVGQLARAYLDRRPEAVVAADEGIRAITYTGPDSTIGLPHPDGGDEMRDRLAVHSAELMLKEWLAGETATAPMPEALVVACRLSTDHAPPALREPLRNAFDRIIAGDVQLYASAPGGLPGYAGAHLYAAMTAAVIDQMNPMVHNHARLVLEGQIRAGQTMAQGMPGAEAVTYVPEGEAAQLLTELLPWTAEMTGAAHETTKRDLRALTQLYLLDHPVPTDEQKAELKALIGRRLDELASALTQRPPRLAAPAPRLSPGQVAARQRVERDLQRAKNKKKRRR